MKARRGALATTPGLLSGTPGDLPVAWDGLPDPLATGVGLLVSLRGVGGAGG